MPTTTPDFVQLLTSNEADQIAYYVSAPCGSGKTYAAAQYMADNLRDPVNTKRFLYVGPSIRILREFSETLATFGIRDVEVFSSENHEHVVSDLMTVFRRGEDHDGSRVIACTHSAFRRLPYRHYQHGWDIIMDEVTQIDEFSVIDARQHVIWMREYLSVEAYNGKVAKVVAKSKARLERLARSGDLEKDVSDALWRILNPNYDVFVDAKRFEQIVLGIGIGNDIFGVGNKNQDASLINLVALVKPTVFAGVTILSANFERTMLHDHLTRHGFKLFEREGLKAGLRYKTYPSSVGERARIRYLLDGNLQYSKSLRSKVTTDDVELKKAMDSAILNQLGDRKFLAFLNKDDDGLLRTSANAVVLEHNVEGLNGYDDHDVVVCLAALNRQPAHLSVLKDIGFNHADVRHATLHEKLHQVLMRTSLRRTDSIAPVMVIVPDKTTAMALARILEASDVERIGAIDMPPPPPKPAPLTSKDMKARSAFKKTMTSIFCDDGQQKLEGLHQESRTKPSRKRGIQQDDPPSNGKTLLLTFTSSKYSEKQEEFVVCGFSPKELSTFMLKAGRNVVERREDNNFLFTMTTFTTKTLDEGFRCQSNFEAAYGLVLDFDDSDFGPECFIDEFWGSAGPARRLSFIVANTFSRSDTQPNRYRVVIPFKRAVHSLEEFQTIYDMVAKRIEAAGALSSPKHLDRTARSGVQIFWLPCTNKAHKDHAFVKCMGMSDGAFDDYGLDPEGYLASRNTVHRLQRVTSTKATPPLTDAQRAYVEWEKQEIRAMTEGRHKPLFDYAVRLRQMRMRPDEIERHLLEIAGSNRRMLRKVKHAMNSLRNYEK